MDCFCLFNGCFSIYCVRLVCDICGRGRNKNEYRKGRNLPGIFAFFFCFQKYLEIYGFSEQKPCVYMSLEVTPKAVGFFYLNKFLFRRSLCNFYQFEIIRLKFKLYIKNANAEKIYASNSEFEKIRLIELRQKSFELI